MQTHRADAGLHEEAVVARVHAFVVLEEQIVGAGEAVVLGRAHARLAGRVARVAATIVGVLGWKEYE